MSTSDLGRHAAILQLVAEQLRSDNFSNETEALYACTDTLLAHARSAVDIDVLSPDKAA